MENQNLEGQEQVQQTQELPKTPYNPLMDVVSEKPYSMGSVSATQEQMSGSIPEPFYQPQSLGSRENPYKTIREGGSPSSGGGSSSEPRPINPSMNEIPDAEKKEGAKYVAKVLMDVYEQVHVWVNNGLQYNQKKLQRLEAEGQIDLGMPLPDGQGNTLTAGGYIQEFNEQVKDALVVDPKWKKETMPILEKVLAKRGASLTDEQMLLFQFGKDAGLKAIQVFQIHSQKKDMIELLKEIKQSMDEGNGGYVAPKKPTPPPPTREQTQPKQEPSYESYRGASSEPSVDVNSNSFNFDTNETVMASSVETMYVPKTGKDRAIAQTLKEKKWKRDAEGGSGGGSDYEKAMAERKTGKRGRTKKSVVDYVNSVDKEDIVDALILEETKREKPSED